MILDDIVEKRREQLEREKENFPLEDMKEMALNSRRVSLDFKAALKADGISIISEVKKASPSRGIISEDFRPTEQAKAYEEAGADAISCLTEEHFFKGADKYLADIRASVNLPILRKDFIFDEYQIYEAKVLGASAVLLICSLMDMEKLKRYMGICGSLGLSSLAEAHTDREVAMAAEAGSDIIGINNRNLETFEVDFTNALRLRKLVDRGTIFVAESGIRTPEDIELLAENQVDAVLVGETLMRAPDKKRALRELKSRIG